MVIKKSISLKNDVYEYAQDKANKLFSSNVSAYIGYLICRDREGIKEVCKEPEGVKDTNLINLIDSIIDI